MKAWFTRNQTIKAPLISEESKTNVWRARKRYKVRSFGNNNVRKMEKEKRQQRSEIRP